MHEVIRALGRLTRALARLRGVRPLLEPWIRALGRGDLEVEMDDFDGDLEVRVRLNEHMESRIFWFGSYSRDVLRALGRLLRSGDVFFDIGANIGEITLYAAKRVGGRGRIIAAEPYPPTAQRLIAHAERNRFDNVAIVESAIGRGEGTTTFFGAPARSRDGLYHSGLNTIFESSEVSLQLTTVPVTSVDRLVQDRGIERVDGLKIDIEGGEMDALRGAEATLSRFRPWIVLEVNRITCRAAGYSAEELLEYLHRRGYGFERVGRQGALTSIDIDGLTDFQNVLCTWRPTVDV